jgi:hypothetical protein
METAHDPQMGDEFAEYFLGTVHGVEVVIVLHEQDVKEDVDLRLLPEGVRKTLTKMGEEAKKPTLQNLFIDPTPPKYELSRRHYYDLLALNESVLLNRSISTHTYLGYLLTSLTVKELKHIHREFTLSGYSNYTKDELIESLKLTI